MTFAEVATIAGYVIVIGGAFGLIWGGGKWMIGTLKKVNEFLEDWRGEDARPGYPGRPGVLERLVKLEEHAATTSHEVQPNSGQSIKDQLNRVDTALPEILSAVKQVPELTQRLAALEGRPGVLAPNPLLDGTQA